MMSELSNAIESMMRIESDKNGISNKWNSLHVLKLMVDEADSPENPQIYYQWTGCKRKIVVTEIPDLSIHEGSYFTRYGMQNALRGLGERYKNDDGGYLVSVKTTHDLNSATINLTDLLFEIRNTVEEV